VHIADAGALDAWASAVPSAARALAEAFWPGPLTLVLPRRQDVPAGVAGGHPTIALRVPNHPWALAILRRFGGGVAAPSANRFGQVSPTSAAHVRRDLGDDVDLVLDGGPCAVGVESTIIDVTSEVPRLLRPGGLSLKAIASVLGRRVANDDDGENRGEGSALPAAPGRLPSHYAPRAIVEVLASRTALEARARELSASGTASGRVGVLAGEPVRNSDGQPLPFACLPADPAAAARALYGALRSLDDAGCAVILTEDFTSDGLGLAVKDRLRKAAAPRG